MGSAVESRPVAPERHGRTCPCPSPHLRQQPLTCLAAQRGTLDTPCPPQPAALGFSSPEIWSLPPLIMSSILPHTVPSWLGCHLGPRPCGVCLPQRCRGILSGHQTRSQPRPQPCLTSTSYPDEAKALFTALQVPSPSYRPSLVS